MALPPAVDRALDASGRVDVVIGLPTYNNASTVGLVLEAARDGLAKHLPGLRAALVCSDAGSTDGTPDAIDGLEWNCPRILARHTVTPAERVAIPFHGIPGRAAAQRTILEACQRLEARACAMLAPDCQTITPEWIDRLLRPVLEDGCDGVFPLYQRERYDGTLTNILIYPLIRALFGRRIRQPLGHHHGLSARLVGHLCQGDARRTPAGRHGIDLWIAAAAAEDFALCEAWLGPCGFEPGGRPTDLGTVFAEAIGAVFAVLDATADIWADIHGSEAVPAIGAPLPLGPGPAHLNVDGMTRGFRLGLKDLVPLWEQVLAPETLAEVLALETATDGAVRFPHDLWARVAYEFALGFHFRTLYRAHLLRSLVPIYLGRTATCVRETTAGGARATEAWIERGCIAFELNKAYLADRWR